MSVTGAGSAGNLVSALYDPSRIISEISQEPGDKPSKGDAKQGVTSLSAGSAGPSTASLETKLEFVTVAESTNPWDIFRQLYASRALSVYSPQPYTEWRVKSEVNAEGKATPVYSTLGAKIDDKITLANVDLSEFQKLLAEGKIHGLADIIITAIMLNHIDIKPQDIVVIKQLAQDGKSEEWQLVHLPSKHCLIRNSKLEYPNLKFLNLIKNISHFDFLPLLPKELASLFFNFFDIVNNGKYNETSKIFPNDINNNQYLRRDFLRAILKHILTPHELIFAQAKLCVDPAIQNAAPCIKQIYAVHLENRNQLRSLARYITGFPLYVDKEYKKYIDFMSGTSSEIGDIIQFHTNLVYFVSAHENTLAKNVAVILALDGEISFSQQIDILHWIAIVSLVAGKDIKHYEECIIKHRSTITDELREFSNAKSPDLVRAREEKIEILKQLNIALQEIAPIRTLSNSSFYAEFQRRTRDRALGNNMLVLGSSHPKTGSAGAAVPKIPALVKIEEEEIKPVAVARPASAKKSAKVTPALVSVAPASTTSHQTTAITFHAPAAPASSLGLSQIDVNVSNASRYSHKPSVAFSSAIATQLVAASEVSTDATPPLSAVAIKSTSAEKRRRPSKCVIC